MVKNFEINLWRRFYTTKRKLEEFEQHAGKE